MTIFDFLVWACVFAFIIYILKKFNNGPKNTLSKNMTGKVVIVTGSSMGIGKEVAFDLLNKGATVIFACRDETRALEAINQIQDEQIKSNACFMKLDLSKFDSIVEFANEFKRRFVNLDVLVNNAGAMFDLFRKENGIEKTIMTNHIGNVVLSAMLLDVMNPQGLILNTSSTISQFINQEQFDKILADTDFKQTERNYGPWKIYSFTKLANILHAIHLDEFARRHEIKIKTASLHPGSVTTEFLNKGQTLLSKIVAIVFIPIKYVFYKDLVMGAQTTLHIIYTDYTRLNSGAYFCDCTEAKIYPIAEQSINVEKLNAYNKKLITDNWNNIPEEVEKYLA